MPKLLIYYLHGLLRPEYYYLFKHWSVHILLPFCQQSNKNRNDFYEVNFDFQNGENQLKKNLLYLNSDLKEN